MATLSLYSVQHTQTASPSNQTSAQWLVCYLLAVFPSANSDGLCGPECPGRIPVGPLAQILPLVPTPPTHTLIFLPASLPP